MYGPKVNGQITLPSASMRGLWKTSIRGQISDGKWENSRPEDHWKFWSDLNVAQGAPGVIADQYPQKSNYALGSVIQYIGDEMVNIGKMATATGSDDEKLMRAAGYMPDTFEEFMSAKESGQWRYQFLSDYMTSVTPEIAEKFYNTKYDMKDLKSDLRTISKAMKSATVG